MWGTRRRSVTETAQPRPLLPPAAANRLADNTAVLLYGNLRPARIDLRPWYRNRRLRQRAEHNHRQSRETPGADAAAAPNPVVDAGNGARPPEHRADAVPATAREQAGARRRRVETSEESDK